MAAKKIRLAFVGTGGMGQAAHLRNYASLPEECEVVALAELDQELGRAVAARYGVPQVFTRATELLAGAKFDALVAAQPFNRHGLIVPALLQAGVPVFIEKPLAASLEVAERLAAADRAAGGRLMVGYHKRSDPATVRVKAEITRFQASGELGELRYLRVTMPPGDFVMGGFNELIPPRPPATPLDVDPPPAGLDADAAQEYVYFVNFYIHQLNLIRHLLGESYEITHVDPARILLVARAASGVTIALEMDPYRTSRDWRESALVAFERGYIRLDLPAPLALNQPGRVEIFRDPPGGEPSVSSPVLPPEHAMRAQAKNFLHFVRGEPSPACGAAEALEDMRAARQWLKLVRGV